ncbi:hypothetical protein [Geminocystis sp. GBBB08]|uniref:hypothetical protein n=1 Tax=Geminocystis sp. GBBB08 TaxID=2604140 RepID=UPI0027E3084F|nr:hypothetical protein [Geminocystis sp. GBBB08]
MNYIINPNCDTSFISGNGNKITMPTARCVMDKTNFELALKESHLVIEKIVKDIPVDIFAILGMRNLSSFIGELFAINFAQKSGGLFMKNPHQDGYPDLLLMDTRIKMLKGYDWKAHHRETNNLIGLL